MNAASPVFAAVVATFGLILGSFFNVLIHRLPAGESVVFPGSRCPSCKKPLRFFHNIPVLSYLFLRGKCAFCHQGISFRYPLIEIITGCCAVILWYVFRNDLAAADVSIWTIGALGLQSLFLLLLVPVSAIDLEHYIIPDEISLPSIAAGILLSFAPGGLTPLAMVLGLFSGSLALYLIGLIGKLIFRKQETMGMGDIKLMAGAGALFGWQCSVESIFFASLIGSIAGVTLMLTKRIREDHLIPFGPYLAVGIWIAALAGDPIVNWYNASVEKLIFTLVR